jgi:hypothetical protein
LQGPAVAQGSAVLASHPSTAMLSQAGLKTFFAQGRFYIKTVVNCIQFLPIYPHRENQEEVNHQLFHP